MQYTKKSNHPVSGTSPVQKTKKWKKGIKNKANFTHQLIGEWVNTGMMSFDTVSTQFFWNFHTFREREKSMKQVNYSNLSIDSPSPSQLMGNVILAYNFPATKDWSHLSFIFPLTEWYTFIQYVCNSIRQVLTEYTFKVLIKSDMKQSRSRTWNSLGVGHETV